MNTKLRKIFLYLLIASGLLAIIGIAVNGIRSRNAGPMVYSASMLTAAERSFDFGEISMKNGKVSHKFELKNTGEEQIIVNKVYTSCMCTTVALFDKDEKRLGVFGMPGHTSSSADVRIEPGGFIIAEAIFDPAAHGPSGTGFNERSIYLETNSSVSPKVELSFTATVAR